MSNRIDIPKTLILLLLMTVHLYGCTGSESSGFSNIPPTGWIYGDTVYFTPGENIAHTSHEDADSVKSVTGEVSVVIRHNNNYEYSNLWLEVKYEGADSLITDTVNITLADDFGKWLGKGIGVSYQQSQKLYDEATVKSGSPIKVSHIMRADTLRDIEQVGIVFIPK